MARYTANVSWSLDDGEDFMKSRYSRGHTIESAEYRRAPAGGHRQRSVSSSSTISSPPLSVRQTRLSPIGLSIEAPCQPGEVNHHPLMGASANFLDLVIRGHGEDYPSPFDHGDFCLCRYALSDGCRCEMADVDSGANCAFAGFQIGANGIERSIFHHQDHHRRRQNRRQGGILKLIG